MIVTAYILVGIGVFIAGIKFGAIHDIRVYDLLWTIPVFIAIWPLVVIATAALVLYDLYKSLWHGRVKAFLNKKLL